MSPEPQDDDPTHALDDFVRRMRPVAPAAPDLSDLQAKLHPQQPSPSARPKRGTLRSGQTWDADDVVDVPLVEMPRVAPAHTDIPALTLPIVDLDAEQTQAAISPDVTLPPIDAPAPPDAAALDNSTRRASAVVAAQWNAEDLANAEPAWQPDPQSLQLRRSADPRLLTGWQPGAWIGALREVFASTTEFISTLGGTAVETYPPHRLLLLWPPQRLDAPTPGRWPQQVRLSAVPADQAAEAVLALAPAEALLWLNPAAGDIDWALAAEIVLHHDSGLRPFQTEGLRRFIEAEREATFARLNADYRQPSAPGPVSRR